jgi:hypothetical protein
LQSSELKLGLRRRVKKRKKRKETRVPDEDTKRRTTTRESVRAHAADARAVDRDEQLDLRRRVDSELRHRSRGGQVRLALPRALDRRAIGAARNGGRSAAGSALSRTPICVTHSRAAALR